MQSQGEDELLSWVPWRQNLPSFTPGQENTRRVEKPWPWASSSHRLFRLVLTGGTERFTRRKRLCPTAEESGEDPAWPHAPVDGTRCEEEN